MMCFENWSLDEIMRQLDLFSIEILEKPISDLEVMKLLLYKIRDNRELLYALMVHGNDKTFWLSSVDPKRL